MKGTIKRNNEFRYAYRRGKKFVTPVLVLHYYKNRGQANQYGITVSTTIGGAVVRNRIKRLIREAYRMQKDTIKSGYNTVWVARGRTAHADFATICSAMQFCIEKSGILRDVSA